MPTMPPIPFGPWEPDKPAFGGRHATEAKNVIPSEGAYRPWPGLQGVPDTHLGETCRGAAALYDDTRTLNIFAGGEKKLYMRVAASFSDVSTSSFTYSCSTGDQWNFSLYGSRVLAANIGDPIQARTLSAGASFASLAGAPNARHIARLRDFLVAGNLRESGTNYPSRVRWSANGDIADWTPSQTTQSDVNDMPEEAGEVTGIIGREYGLIFQERAISRMQFVGGATIFQFDTVEENRGCVAPGSIIPFGRGTGFLSQDGFYYFNGASSEPIGDNRVNKWFFNEFSDAERRRMSGALDYANQVMLWTVPYSSGANAALVMAFSFKDNRWSYAEQEIECLIDNTRATITLEDLDAFGDLDTLTDSLDSDVWITQGRLRAAAFASVSAAGQYALFRGDNLQAVLETGEFEVAPGRRAQIEEMWPVVDNTAGTVTGQIGTRAGKIGDTLTWSTAASQNASGYCPTRAEGRVMRARVTVPAAAEWTHAQGVGVRFRPTGRR